MANVGASIVIRLSKFFLVAGCAAILSGCNAGSVSADQQQAKKDALDKVAKKMEGPNFVRRH